MYISVQLGGMEVVNIQIKSLAPTVSKPEVVKLLPKTLTPMRVSFELHKVNNSVSNALRRTIACELLVKALYADYVPDISDDEFIIPEMILNRLVLIPIDQQCPDSTIFSLNVTNNNAHALDVKTSDIQLIGGGKHAVKLPFNETFTICTLNPGKSINIPKIVIKSNYGYNFAGYCVACNAVSLALDQHPINTFDPSSTGISVSTSNPQVWKLQFNTNGSMQPKSIVAAACDNIIGRVKVVQELLVNIDHNNGEYILQIIGESDTVGNLLMRTIHDLYPKIGAVVYNVETVGRVLVMRVVCDEDIMTVYETAIDHLVKLFSEIKVFFN